MVKGFLQVGKAVGFPDASKDVDDIAGNKPPIIVPKSPKYVDAVFPKTRQCIAYDPSRFRTFQLSKEFAEVRNRIFLEQG